MDLKQLEYIIAISDYGNITAAAEHLYVTPSALNQQLIKLEGELGLSLFVRNYRRMEPTAAGRLYLENARRILEIKQNTYSELQDMVGRYDGECRLGIPFEHGMDAILECYKPFQKKYPNIQLICREGMVNWQIEQIQSGALDVGFVLLTDKPQTDDQYFQLSEENLLLGMPINHPLAHLALDSKGKYPIIDLALLKDDSFCLMQRHSTQRQRIDPLFHAAGYTPYVIMESSQNRAVRNMAARQNCCCIVPQTYATDRNNLVWFSLPTYPRFTFYAMLKKGLRPSKAITDLIALVRSYSQTHFDFPLP